MSMLPVDKAEIYYETHGKGYPLILIAGLSCDLNLWLRIQETLTKHFQLILFDNRGVGRTHYQGPFNIDTMANDVLALMNHLKIERAFVLGHSMGGAILQSLAARHPERLAKMIISHSLIQFKPKARLALAHNLKLNEQNAPIKDQVEAKAPWIFSNAFLSKAENIESIIQLNEGAAYPQSTQGYKDQIAALLEFNSFEWFQSIKVPALVLAGIEDILAPASENKILADGLHAQFHLMSGAHIPLFEEPEAYAELVRDFLS